MNARLAVLAAVLLTPLTAHAADFPVTYTVEEKPLKTAIAGTPLTFTLHRNASCADAAVSTYVVNIEDVTFLSKLKMFTPKNDAKIPNTVELHHTLVGITATGNLFLKVTGAGITPVGGLCQPQSAQARTLVPPVTAVIQYGRDINEVWGIEDPLTRGFPDSTVDLLVADESSSAFLSGLDQTNGGTRYSCQLRVPTKGLVLTPSGFYASLFGIDSCVACTNPYPGCL